MLERKSWEEFRETGLFWWINSLLHIFGWALVADIKHDKVIEVYPARTSFRGFSESANDRGYTKVSKYMKENAETLLAECEQE